MGDSFQPQQPHRDPVSNAFDKAESVSDRLTDKAADVRDGASRFAREASARLGDASHAASDAVSRAADYLRDQDLRHVVDEVKDYTRRHPAQALLTAAALGFFAAVLVRRG